MRKLRFLSFFFCAIAALTFTSCLNDDDDNNGLSREQQQQCFMLTSGGHTGKLYYAKNPNANVTNNNDSVDVSWTIISDSTMTFHDIPSKAIASAFSDSTIQKAIAAQPDVDIPCYIGYFMQNPVEWLINPQTITYNVNYGGANHKIDVAFYANNTYSFGVYYTESRSMTLQIVIGAARVDGNFQSNLIPRGVGLQFAQRRQR